MWITGVATVLSALAGGPGPSDLLARLAMYRHQEYVPEARIWFDRGVDPVLQRGDRVSRLLSLDREHLCGDLSGRYRWNRPGWRIRGRPVKTTTPGADRDCQLLFPRSPYWTVDDRPGMGYFFIVTSPTPFDFSDFRYSYYDGGWDLSVVEKPGLRRPLCGHGRVCRTPHPRLGIRGLWPRLRLLQRRSPRTSILVSCATIATASSRSMSGIRTAIAARTSGSSCTTIPTSIPHGATGEIEWSFVGGSFPSGPALRVQGGGRVANRETPLVRRVPAADRDDEPGADPTGRRAIPRGGVPAPEARRPTDSRDPLAGRPQRSSAPAREPGRGAGVGCGRPAQARSQRAWSGARPGCSWSSARPGYPWSSARSGPPGEATGAGEATAGRCSALGPDTGGAPERPPPPHRAVR